MRRGTLNVDTRSNTFRRLRKDAHALFDKGGIILLPEGDVVEKYRRHGKPDFDEDHMNNVRYKYPLIASETTDGCPLHRLPFPARPGEIPEAVNFPCPFADFPVLEFHVHPCFVICLAGRFKPNLYQYFSSTSHDLYVSSADDCGLPSLVLNSSITRGYPLIGMIASAMMILTRIAWTMLHTDEVSDSRTRTTDRPRLHRSVGARSGNAPVISVTVAAIPDTKDSQGLRALKAENSHPHTYKLKREFVRDWVSSVIGQTFVEDDALISQNV